jgi:hypothetical protein
MLNQLAQNFGNVTAPAALAGLGADPGTGIGKLIQLSVRLLIIGAAIYALFNFVLAGYAFLSAGDDPKKIAGAWGTIWQSALGLAVAAGSFVLAAIFGRLIFGPTGWTFLLNPVIPAL